MKTNLKFGIATIILLSFLHWQCKDEDVFFPYGDDAIGFNFDWKNNTFDDLKTEEYTFEFDPHLYFEYTFPDFSRLTFDPSIFQLDISPSECSTVKAVVRRALVKKDMVANGVGTNSNNEILESSGMFYLEIFCNGKSVNLKPGAKYQIQIPVDQSNINPEVDLFYGEETRTGINWVEADKNPNNRLNVFFSEWEVDSFGLKTGITCFPERLKWVNCDYFLKFDSIDLTEACLIVSTNPGNDTITFNAYCVFKDYNAVLRPCCVKNSEKICFSALPIGQNVIYILVGKGKVDYYLGYVEKKVEKDEMTQIHCQKKTLQEVKDFISML
ncbi:MAG TPA: hypothetical protein PKD32_01690 [Saprospiraceae bacterium]|nr:hypothetical protein [Saprospiraceae bacterium]